MEEEHKPDFEDLILEDHKEVRIVELHQAVENYKAVGDYKTVEGDKAVGDYKPAAPPVREALPFSRTQKGSLA